MIVPYATIEAILADRDASASIIRLTVCSGAVNEEIKRRAPPGNNDWFRAVYSSEMLPMICCTEGRTGRSKWFEMEKRIEKAVWKILGLP